MGPLDLNLAPEPARAPEPALAPELADAPDRDTPPVTPSPYLPFFAAAFERAYGPDGWRCLEDTACEAATFGDVHALDVLAREGFGPATDPAANVLLVGALGTEAGQDAVLHRYKDGPETPGRGDDLVVLLDREGAGISGLGPWAAFGHTAVLVGNDHDGWQLYSKDGKSAGDTSWTNNRGSGQTAPPQFASYATLDAFFRDSDIADRYEAAVRVEFAPDGDTDIGAQARAAALAIINEDYHLLDSSCAHVVQSALEAAGVEGFSMTTTRNIYASGSYYTVETRNAPIIPKRQFGDLADLEAGDDLRSEAWIAWETRSGSDGR